MKRKLKSNSGESLVETLVALMIIVLVFVFLVNSIVTASTLNKTAEAIDQPFSYSESTPMSENVTLTLSGDDFPNNTRVSVQGYVCQNAENQNIKFYYYKYQPETGD